MRPRVAALVAILVVPGGVARAHDRGASTSVAVLRDGGATLRVAVPLVALPAGPSDAAWAERLTRGVVLDGCAVRDGSFAWRDAEPGWAVAEWALACPSPPRALRCDLAAWIPGHVHLAHVVAADGRRLERVLDGRDRELVLSRPPPPALSRFVLLGIEHLAGGADHLLFLLTILLAARRAREVALVASGFTAGHAATLALATLGVVAPRPAAVEVLIGLSIVVVAIENVWLAGGRRGLALPAAAVAATLAFGGAGAALFVACHLALVARSARPLAQRTAVAAAFGLVHGLGFAGALGAGDLPPAMVTGALLAFNAGVELGQLAAIALAWPLLALLRRSHDTALCAAGSAVALAAGTAWTLARALG